MATQPTCVWPGASGHKYTYYVYPLEFQFSENQCGNYLITSFVNGHWQPNYIGQGDLKSRFASHLADGCVKKKGTSHVHAHTNSVERDRLNEEADLLANFPQAYVPTGCNKKIGG